MTVFDSIKNKNIDEIADWIDEHSAFDDVYWRWWNENYCDKCEPIKTESTNFFGYSSECAYCELNNNCRFFKDMKEIPNRRQVIKMWLESECT